MVKNSIFSVFFGFFDFGLDLMSFEGFGPGKSHLGKFDNWNGELFLENQEIVGFEGTIQTNSVNTGIGGLDTHLNSEDFFNSKIIKGKPVLSARIKEHAKTILELKRKKAKIIIISHQSRPGESDFTSLREHSKLLNKFSNSRT